MKCKLICKKHKSKERYKMLFFLLGSISIYMCCQILKSSKFIETNEKKYNQCLQLLDDNCPIREQDVIKICQNQNQIETFQSFAYNLFITLLIIYPFNHTIIQKHNLSNKYWLCYWLISHISAIVFSLVGEISFMQFSIDSDTQYKLPMTILLSVISIITFSCIMRKILYCKFKFNLIFAFSMIYLIIYLSFRFITNNITYHFHHSLISIFISFFFTDLDSKIDLLMHSILLGITIQGFSFFKTTELFMFYVSDLYLPNTFNLSIIYAIFFGLLVGCLFIRRFYCIKKKINKEVQEFEIPLLIPITNHYEEY